MKERKKEKSSKEKHGNAVVVRYAVLTKKGRAVLLKIQKMLEVKENAR